MLDTVRQFISEIFSSEKQDQIAFDERGYRVAATALLIHVISLDGAPSDIELEKLHVLLQDRFELNATQADQLVTAATRVEGEAIDIYHFTSVLMRTLDEEGRQRIIEMMWELIYVDGRVSEFEESIVWRAADLLGISSRDRINLRIAVAGASNLDA